MPITLDNVSYTYGSGTPFETDALKGVGFTIEHGEFVGIMGHTGCGKSTVIQLMAGLLRPASGTITIDGEDINDKHYDRMKLREKVGIVFQYPESQLFESTVEKDVAFGLKHSGMAKEDVEARVRWALEVTGFNYEKTRRKSPMGLSGGEKRRVAIAGVLAVKPEYLILDEPIAGLDPLGRKEFLDLITDLNHNGMTIIMVSHNADSIGEYADRILVFSQGELVLDGSVHNVFRDVEKMRSLSVGVSQSREIAYMLNKGGIPVPDDTASYDELLAAVVSILNEGGRKH